MKPALMTVSPVTIRQAFVTKTTMNGGPYAVSLESPISIKTRNIWAIGKTIKTIVATMKCT